MYYTWRRRAVPGWFRELCIIPGGRELCEVGVVDLCLPGGRELSEGGVVDLCIPGGRICAGWCRGLVFTWRQRAVRGWCRGLWSCASSSASPRPSPLNVKCLAKNYGQCILMKYRVFVKYCDCSKNFHNLRPLPRQHWAAIGCTENYRKWPAHKRDCTLRSLTR